jgi:hypothetical protein
VEYRLLAAILHGHQLDEPLTWIYLIALVAVAVAGWKFGDIAFELSQRGKGEE